MRRRGDDPLVVTKETLSQYFDHPLSQAAIDLGISPTALKALCRKLEVDHSCLALRCALEPLEYVAHVLWWIGQEAFTMLLTPALALQIVRWPFQRASWISSRAKKLSKLEEVWSSDAPTIYHANPPAQASGSMTAAQDQGFAENYAAKLVSSSRHTEIKHHDQDLKQMLERFDEIEMMMDRDVLPSSAQMFDCYNTEAPTTRAQAAVLSDNLRDRQLLSLASYLRESSPPTEAGEAVQLTEAGFTMCDMSWLVNMDFNMAQ